MAKNMSFCKHCRGWLMTTDSYCPKCGEELMESDITEAEWKLFSKEDKQEATEEFLEMSSPKKKNKKKEKDMDDSDWEEESGSTFLGIMSVIFGVVVILGGVTGGILDVLKGAIGTGIALALISVGVGMGLIVLKSILTNQNALKMDLDELKKSLDDTRKSMDDVIRNAQNSNTSVALEVEKIAQLGASIENSFREQQMPQQMPMFDPNLFADSSIPMDSSAQEADQVQHIVDMAVAGMENESDELEASIEKEINIAEEIVENLEEEEEAKRKAEEEAERKAKEEAERKAKEEAERKAKEEAERKAKEEAKRRAEEEAKRKAEEAKHRAEEEAKLKAEEEAKRKAEEAKRRAEEEAKRKAKEEEERKLREEMKRRNEQQIVKQIPRVDVYGEMVQYAEEIVENCNTLDTAGEILQYLEYLASQCNDGGLDELIRFITKYATAETIRGNLKPQVYKIVAASFRVDIKM